MTAAIALEQRQLDIPDIALAVSAAASAASATSSKGGAAAAAGSKPGCHITAVCTAASSGGCGFDSLAVPPAAAVGEEDAGPVEQRHQRQAAAVTVFAADSAGGVWQLATGELAAPVQATASAVAGRMLRWPHFM